MELIQLDWQMSNYTFTAVDSIKWPLMLSWSVQKVYKISKTLAVVASSSVATGGVLGPVRPVTCPLHSRVVGQSSQSSSSLSPGCKLSDQYWHQPVYKRMTMAQNWIMLISELHRYQGVSYKSDIIVISGNSSCSQSALCMYVCCVTLSFLVVVLWKYCDDKVLTLTGFSLELLIDYQ